MLSLFLGKRMTGGLHFGPAGWTPEDWALPQPVTGSPAAAPPHWLVAVGTLPPAVAGKISQTARALLPLEKQSVTRGTLLVSACGADALVGIAPQTGETEKKTGLPSTLPSSPTVQPALTADILSPADGLIDGLQDIEHVGGGMIQALLIRRADPAVLPTPTLPDAPAKPKPRPESPVDAKSLAQRLRRAGIGTYVLALGSL
ncbi:MAG: hypothetical protein WCI73_05845, partial [Phycisphaerae bacterium]